MPGSYELRILGDFWKKGVSWDLKLDEASWFLDLGEASSVGSTRCAARDVARWNSPHSKKCVSLSSCRKPKSQEGNKSFVPESRKSSVFRVFFRFRIFRIFYASVYLYILRNHILAMLHLGWRIRWLQRSKTSLTSVLDMTLNNLMVRLH